VTDTKNFPFRFELGYRRAALLFGVTAGSTSITISEDMLRVRFGTWRVRTPLSNIVQVEITGPYRFLKTAGPARLGLTDRGLTFATNHEQGVCMDFRQPITGIDPLGVVHHPNLTLTPADCDGLARALQS
jgi:hypothetical protein